MEAIENVLKILGKITFIGMIIIMIFLTVIVAIIELQGKDLLVILLGIALSLGILSLLFTMSYFLFKRNI